MLGKLLKYDLRATAGPMLISYVILLGYGAILKLSGMELDLSGTYAGIHWMMQIFLYIGFVVVMVGVMLFTYVQILRRFYTNLFSSQGYLTNTLPVRPSQLVLSKVLMGVFWLFATNLLLFACVVLLGTELPAALRQTVFSAISLALNRTPGENLALAGLAFVFSLFASVLVFYACICLGQLFAKARILAAVLIYLGWTLAEGTLTSLVTGILVALVGPEQVDLVALVLADLYYAVVILGAFFLCSYILRRHLNLQ